MTTTTEMIGSGTPVGTAKGIVGNVDSGVTATGNSSTADSYLIRASVTEVTGGGATTGVRLPEGHPGDLRVISNNSGSNCLLYPPTGGVLNDGSANAAETLGDTTCALVAYVTNIRCVAVLGA